MIFANTGDVATFGIGIDIRGIKTDELLIKKYKSKRDEVLLSRYNLCGHGFAINSFCSLW